MNLWSISCQFFVVPYQMSLIRDDVCPRHADEGNEARKTAGGTVTDDVDVLRVTEAFLTGHGGWREHPDGPTVTGPTSGAGHRRRIAALAAEIGTTDPWAASRKDRSSRVSTNKIPVRLACRTGFLPAVPAEITPGPCLKSGFTRADASASCGPDLARRNGTAGRAGYSA